MAEIRITFDGDVPGIAEHRLSLSAFAKPLDLFLTALRRTASQIVSSALDGETPDVGRFNNLARQMDIEIEGIGEGSVILKAIMPFRHAEGELPLFADLPQLAANSLIDGIENESQGRPSSAVARKYLRSLPNGLNKQVYEVYEGGQRTKELNIGSIVLSNDPVELPFLREYKGNVVGLGFEPGKTEVRLKSESATSVVEASAEDVEQALTLRKSAVRLFAVQSAGRARLLSIAAENVQRPVLSSEAKTSAIFDKWGSVFAELAK